MLKLTGTYKDLNEYNVYSITRADNPDELLFIGAANTTNMLEMREFRRTMGFNLNTEYTITVLKSYPTLAEAVTSAQMYAVLYSPTYSFTTGKSAVRCVETGEVYKSGYAAAKALGLGWSALCNHLNGKPGFKTVKGFTFTRV